MRQVPGLGSPAAGCASPIGPRCPCLTGWVRRYAQVFPQLGPSGSSSRPCQSGQPATPRTAHGSQSGRSYCEDDFDASPLTPTVPCLAVAINIFGTSAGSIAPGLPRRHASAPAPPVLPITRKGSFAKLPLFCPNKPQVVIPL